MPTSSRTERGFDSAHFIHKPSKCIFRPVPLARGVRAGGNAHAAK
jgi:hypothetical protein